MIRKQILNYLAAHQDRYVSGEGLSQELNMTRAAIWKHISALKQEGYVIEAVPKRGYRLLALPRNLDEWALEYELKARGRRVPLYFYEDIDSTNVQAKQLAKKLPGEVPEAAVVVAKTQRLGRGRLGRVWASPLGGLWMSVLLKPNLSLTDAAKTTLAAGIGVVHALQELYGLQARLKWPNDIVYRGKKLAGILGEVVGEWTVVQNLVLGIGINGNFPSSGLPPDVEGTTLLEIVGEEVNLNQLGAAVLDHVLKQIEILENEGAVPLRKSWMGLAVGIGKPVRLSSGGEEVVGICEGIDEDGALIVRQGQTRRTFTAGDVHLRSAQGRYDLEE